jgi:uncharacterized protein (TIGR01777 family)
MRVVVSGSSGFIGRSLVVTLRRAGHEITPLVRRAPRPGEAHWDPETGAIDIANLGGADAVVHLAGAGIGDKRWSAARRKVIVSSRVESTSLLARSLAGLDHPPSVLVSASAVGYYGDRGDEELTEDSGRGTGFLAELCGAWEEASEPAEHAGIRVVRWRSGVVLSPGGGVLARQLPLFRLGLGGRLGSGRQWLSWISMRDEIDAIVFALGHSALRGPVNATAPTPVTNREFTEAMGKVLRRPTALAVPQLALRAALGPDLATETALASQRVVPKRLMAEGFRFEHPVVVDALATLSARPR